MAAYSMSLVLRRTHPIGAVALSLATGVAYSGALYPLALMPVALLTVYTAATRLAEGVSRGVLAVSLLASTLAATIAPGPTNTGVPILVAGAWFLGHYVRARRWPTWLGRVSTSSFTSAGNGRPCRRASTSRPTGWSRRRYGDAAVTVEVADDGVGGTSPATSGGHGLLGMRERVAVHGGTLEAAPGRPAASGWRLVSRWVGTSP